MLPILVFSILTGIMSTLISLQIFDAGLLSAAMWYVLGSWTGFSISLAMVLLSNNWRGPPSTQMHANFG